MRFATRIQVAGEGVKVALRLDELPAKRAAERDVAVDVGI
jgi:hypothetical protein